MAEAGKSEVEEDYKTLCAELNMDEETKEEAWHAYNKAIQNYTLEGNKIHWLACALYVACRKSTVPTVGSQKMVEGNGVSLTRLLRNANLSLIEFFDKAKKWADMTNMKADMVDKIEKLRRNFITSHVIYKKYQPIFSDLFKDLNTSTPRPKTSRKQKRTPCTVSELFEFTWTLFIRVKSVFAGISDDLVNSYHLLLTCLDYVYANAYLDRRNDLLKEEIVKTEEENEPGNGASRTVPCILDRLCSQHDGISNEVKSIREHYWKPYIKKLFDEKRLRGDEENLCGVLDKDLFESNLKSIRREYEAYVLSIGEYDERVFLGEEATTQIGTPTKMNVATHRDADLAEKLGTARRNLTEEFGTSLIPSTPLSGRRYIAPRDSQQQMLTPITNATYLVTRLHKILSGQKAEPSSDLMTIFNKFSPTIADRIKEKVTALGQKFTQRYTAPSDDGHPGSHASFTAARLNMGEKLFYKILEKIIIMEQRTQKSLGTVLEQDVFIQAVFSASLEIVMSSYNSQRNFPWILDTFSLEAYQFYKVIEIIIRAEDGLARDMVKHLQGLEERILESQAWVSSSSVWEAIKATSEHGIPTSEEVSLPSHDLQVGQSPVSHHRSYQIRSPMTGERFRSPVVSAVARRQLFTMNDSSGGEAKISILPNTTGQNTVSGQSLLTSNQQQNVPASPGGGGPQSIPFSPVKISVVPVATPLQQQNGVGGTPSKSGKPRRTGALALFFRKVYSLAETRLDTLCTSMQIHDEELRRKIWTCFEFTLVHHIHLMMDRHLDQLIMCSLYIVCKVSGKQFEKNFTDIMKHYRNQPQCASHVYRSVLLRKKLPAETAAAANQATNKPPPTPTKLANSSTVGEDGVERGDLIMFYNTVYMEKVQEFALKFRRASSLPPLSPLPMLRAYPASPCRKVSDSHSLYVRALKPGTITSQQQQAAAGGGGLVLAGAINNHFTAGGGGGATVNFTSPMKPRALSYNFSSSPAKDLDAINRMVRTEGRKKVGKRLLVDEGEEEGEGEDTSTGPKIIRSTGDTGQPNKMLDFLINERSSLKT